MDWTPPSPKWSSKCLWMAEVSEAGLMMLMAIKKQNRHSKNRGICWMNPRRPSSNFALSKAISARKWRPAKSCINSEGEIFPSPSASKSNCPDAAARLLRLLFFRRASPATMITAAMTSLYQLTQGLNLEPYSWLSRHESNPNGPDACDIRILENNIFDIRMIPMIPTFLLSHFLMYSWGSVCGRPSSMPFRIAR